MTTDANQQVPPFEAMTPTEQAQHLATGHSLAASNWDKPYPLDQAGRQLAHDEGHNLADYCGHDHLSLTEHAEHGTSGGVPLTDETIERLAAEAEAVQLPETAMDRHWRGYERALATATRLAEESASAWDGADRHGKVVTYGDSGVPCHEVAAMLATQAQAWAAIAAARYLPMHPPGGVA
jgi:hypothetical protein